MRFHRPACKPSPIQPIVSGKAPQIATSAADKPLQPPSKIAVLNPETELQLPRATDVSVFQKRKNRRSAQSAIPAEARIPLISPTQDTWKNEIRHARLPIPRSISATAFYCSTDRS